MMIYAESSIFSNATNQDGSAITVKVKSKSNPDKEYTVDLTHGRCSCPAWVYRKGPRKPCVHLLDLGYYDVSGIESLAEPKKEILPTMLKEKVPYTGPVAPKPFQTPMKGQE